jgi:hypothetical protein
MSYVYQKDKRFQLRTGQIGSQKDMFYANQLRDVSDVIQEGYDDIEWARISDTLPNTQTEFK